MFRMVKSVWLLRRLIRSQERTATALEKLVKLTQRQMRVSDEFEEEEEGAEVLYTRDADTWEWEQRDAHARAKNEGRGDWKIRGGE